MKLVGFSSGVYSINNDDCGKNNYLITPRLREMNLQILSICGFQESLLSTVQEFSTRNVIIMIIAHIYNAPNTLFLGAAHTITPVIGFRLTRNTMNAHFPLPGELTSRSPFYKGQLLIQPV